jgi:hypothetical protein
MQYQSIYFSWESVQFIDANHGWVVGRSTSRDNSPIFTTTDGGEHWTLQESKTSQSLHTVCFVDAKTGWVVGGSGIILKTSMGGATSVKELNHANSTIPDRMTLSQNYPNPFNPSTTIRFGLAQQGFVTLSIFDLLGREIETLVSGVRSTGEYEVTWTAKDLPSGIYLVRLEAGASVQTKKLILQK